MIVEIRGTNLVNKGAELMLQVVMERLRAANPQVEFAVERWFGPFTDRAKYGLQCIAPRGGKRDWILGKLLPKSYRDIYGVVDHREVEAVVDASGFACGDQWGLSHMQRLALHAKDWNSRGIPTVFLPQAFGPFTGGPIRTAAKSAFENLDLVFAREKTSLQFISDLGVSGNHIHQAHDFTNLAKGSVPEHINLPERLACVVPNFRMLKNADDQKGDAYLTFMKSAIDEARKHGLEPLYVFHDKTNDEKIAKLIDSRLGDSVPSLECSCPRTLKGVLGRAQLVIGSRFHALVGALSQGVPALATSWSHKYEELLQEYGTADFVFDPAENDRVRDVVSQLSDEKQNAAVRETLNQRAAYFLAQSEDTFRKTLTALGLQSEAAE